MDVLSGFIVEFDRDAVVHQDESGFAWARNLAIGLTLDTGALCHIEMVVDGYNDDPRSLYEVPEVRRWVRGFSDTWADVLFWATPGTLWTALLSLYPAMWSRLPDHSLRFELDPESLSRRFASNVFAGTALLRERGLKKRQVKAAQDQAMGNLLGLFERRRIGDYVVLHPKERTVVTYRSED